MGDYGFGLSAGSDVSKSLQFRALSDTSDLRTSASQLFSLSASQLFAFSERAWQKFLGVGGTPVEKKSFFLDFPVGFLHTPFAPNNFFSFASKS